MTSAAAGNTIDLERELSCSICTDVFYQPLTLLDCLHTFCGSCLKEWFSWQATSATHNSRAASPYTCPSCRAPVRAARPNANVTTLLDMYLQANPTKGKTEDEKAEMRKNYTPGDDVIPPIEVHPESDDSEDERLIDEIREMTVADLNPGVEANRRALRTERGAGHRRDRERERNRDRDNRRHNAADARRRQEAVERNVAHQPSLRSLLSAAGADSTEVQEILASIFASGVLDGVDVENLTAEQEDELAERITETYHRRNAARARDHRPAETRASARSTSGEHAANSHQPIPPRSRPPVSRPHLIDQWTQETSQDNRRVTSEHRRRESSTTTTGAAVEPVPATRSATDPVTRDAERDGAAERRRRAVPSSRSNTNPSTPVQNPPAGPDVRRENALSRNTPPHTPPSTNDAHRGFPPYPVTQTGQFLSEQSRHQDSPVQHDAPALYIPHVACNRCGRDGIQHSLHYHCSTCSNGDFDLCLRCYRTGQGCNHWFGFGYAAMARWRKNAPPGGYSPGYELPHILIPRRYVKMSPDHGTAENTLQEGAFCEGCFQYADRSYWHCNDCFEGAWGYCLACVQQEKHCTHPLAPVTRIRDQARLRTNTASPVPLPHLPTGDYYFDTTATACAVCNIDIPAEHTRLHCPQCNNGNYNICNDSYYALVAAGKISAADGPSGRRRCLHGHPMTVVAFRKVAEGIFQRVVVSEAVGGWQANQKSHTTTMLPQSSLRAFALWSWWPADGVDDELAFPKHAEITEVEKINNDYYVGVYAGSKGLFPANHVKDL